MNDKIFADGLSFYEPGPKAPDYVLGKIALNSKKLTAFMAQHADERGWVNLDVKRSKNGNVYVELNTWRPNQTPKAEGDREVPAKEDDQEFPG